MYCDILYVVLDRLRHSVYIFLILLTRSWTKVSTQAKYRLFDLIELIILQT